MNDQTKDSLAVNMLTRAAILGAVAMPTERVEVPEWGGVVLVRAMTAAERDEFEASMLVEKGQTRSNKFLNVRARMCATCLVQEDGRTPMFSKDDIEALGRLSARALNRVFEKAQALSGFSNADVKELEGN